MRYIPVDTKELGDMVQLLKVNGNATEIHRVQLYLERLLRSAEEPFRTHIVWGVEDVITVAFNNQLKVTDEEAEDFLFTNQKYLRDQSIEVGWEILDTLFTEWASDRDLQPEDDEDDV